MYKKRITYIPRYLHSTYVYWFVKVLFNISCELGIKGDTELGEGGTVDNNWENGFVGLS